MKIYVVLDDYAGYESRYIGKHGVSYYIDAPNTKVLFDTGQDSDSILHNMNLMGINPKNITHIFLSHNHYDHTGGLIGVLKEIGKKIPVIAHKDLFRRNFVVEPYLREIGIPFTKSEVERYSYLYLVREPIKIDENIFSTGEIVNRLDFEKISIATYTIRDGMILEDPMNDDMSLCINTSNGLIIVSGCSHAGIISIVKRCMEVTGVEKIRMVIGGFHLVKATRDRIDKTVEWFKKLDVREIYTGHCTGLNAESRLKEEYGENFHKLQSGMVIEV